MTDTAIPDSSAASGSVAPIAAPSPAAPAASPVGSPAVTEAAAPSPIVATTPGAEAPVAVTVPAGDAESPTILGVDPVKSPVAEVKAVEADKAPAIKSEDGSQSDKTAQLPVYEAFKLPEGMKPDGEGLTAFIKDLAELQVSTKAEQAMMQAFGQKIIDRYVADTQKTAELVRQQVIADNQKKYDSWKADFEKSPDKDTVLKAASIGLSVLGTEAEQKDFRQALNETYAGNNPAIIRGIAKMGQVIADMRQKYESESGVKPLPASAPAQQVKGMANKMYGSMSK